MSAFNLIHEKHISGVGVVNDKGALVGALSGSDIKLIGNFFFIFYILFYFYFLGLDSNIHRLFLPYSEIASETNPVLFFF